MSATLPLPDTSDPVVAPFWEAAQRGELRLPRKLDGSGFDWYPSGEPAEWVEVKGTGTLFTWAVVTRPLHPGYAGIAPYISAIVELDDAPGVRLVTRMLAEPDELKLGAPVEVVFADLGTPGEPVGVTGPLFRLKR